MCRSQGYGLDLYQEAKYLRFNLPLSILAYYTDVASEKHVLTNTTLLFSEFMYDFNGAR